MVVWWTRRRVSEAGDSAGEPQAGAANMAPGAHRQLEVAPRLVGSASGQIAILADLQTAYSEFADG
jgi:hypothetical protein